MPPEDPTVPRPAAVPVVKEKKTSLPIKPVTKVEKMREWLRSLKQNHKDDDAKVKRAFQTLLTYVGNVAKNPDEEKFIKIRLTNQSFQVCKEHEQTTGIGYQGRLRVDLT